jgi:hypothetical protein
VVAGTTKTPLKRDIELAAKAARRAQQVREDLRWDSTPGDVDREGLIAESIRSINAAMEPIRSHIGRLRYEPQPAAVERALREVSQDLGYQRRQLKKMRRR